MMMAALMLCACSQETALPTSDATQTKRVTFLVTSNGWDITRALTADGQDMTDLWIFDYIGGELVGTTHKTGTDSDISTPTLALDYGQHTLYFVASRGKTPQVSGTTITWATPSDTFWSTLEMSVTGATPTSKEIALDRVATKLKVIIKDQIPTNTAALEITPATWWYGIDYTTGAATSSSAAVRSITVPENMLGTTNKLVLSIFGISDTSEWMADVDLKMKDTDGNVIGGVAVEDVPFVRNRATEISGNLFGGAQPFEITLNAEWDDAYEMEW